jgi:hypothetical protein
MSLLDSEIARIKAELGFNLMENGAHPWVDVVSIFEQVIQPYVGAGASTTSATSVTAEGLTTLTLTSATGFTAGDAVSIDVGINQERSSVQSVSGSTVAVRLSKAHSGTYPVSVEGGESIIREILLRIAEVKTEMAESEGAGTLKQVDEVQWYQAGQNMTGFSAISEKLQFWRNELASVLGLESMWDRKAQGAQTMSVY